MYEETVSVLEYRFEWQYQNLEIGFINIALIYKAF